MAAIRNGAVAIAAITSCTNTTDPRLTIAAGPARAQGAGAGAGAASPGSRRRSRRARPRPRSTCGGRGCSTDLEALGFGIVGFGCMTCIGNSGALVPEMEAAIVEDGGIVPAAVLSGNRNFPGRVHPLLQAGFLASPPLVVAYRAGRRRQSRHPDRASRPATSEGRDVFLADLWPGGEEIDAVLTEGTEALDFPRAFAAASANPVWDGIEAPVGELYPWEEASTYLRRPPFTRRALGSRLGDYEADPILVLGDDISTDQISPAGAVPKDSEAAAYLVAEGEDAAATSTSMPRAAATGAPWSAGSTPTRACGTSSARTCRRAAAIDPETGEVLPLYRLAERLAARGRSAVIVAGERYGQGSSRDWAAKGPALLGVRAVLAASFERIHRTNLIGMGILPLRLPRGVAPADLGLRPGDVVRIAAAPERVAVRGEIAVAIVRRSRPAGSRSKPAPRSRRTSSSSCCAAAASCRSSCRRAGVAAPRPNEVA